MEVFQHLIILPIFANSNKCIIVIFKLKWNSDFAIRCKIEFIVVFLQRIRLLLLPKR